MMTESDLSQHISANTMVAKLQVKELHNLFSKVLSDNIEGDYVECGVWRGGLSCLVLNEIVSTQSNKKMWLYDTFEGMTAPTEHDIYFDGSAAKETFETCKNDSGTASDWCKAEIEIVSSNLERVSSSYKEIVSLIKGPVEETLSVDENLPEIISLMRLDTDWYESTKIELEKFWPRLSKQGFIILDDYSSWLGQKKAVDEFLQGLDPDSYVFSLGAKTSGVIQKI